MKTFENQLLIFKNTILAILMKDEKITKFTIFNQQQ